jgi:formylglycine-generating enzyme required for sulfatase activity
VGGLAQDWGDERCPGIFAEGLGENPRQIKRTVNMFLMLWKLADRRELKEKITPTRLAKVVAIQAMYPHLYNRVLKDVPRYLRSLEEYYRAEAGPEKTLRGAGEDVEGHEAREPVKAPAALEPFVGRAPLRRIMTQLLDSPEACFSDLTGEQLSVYFTLARSAEAPGAEDVIEERLLFEPQTVRISAGKFLMGSTPEQVQRVIADAPKSDKDSWKKWTAWEQPQHEVELSEYSIGKYPVTNREYQAYVQATKTNPPKGWDGENYPPEKGDHPVVYVSWDDARNYCEWLSGKTNKAYRLPTEAEWEKAARWKVSPDEAEGEALVYPWGNEFDKERCNVDESGIGDTTPVDRYENGVSPYGVYDMVGNVWEWCQDWFDEDEYKKRSGQEVKDPPGPEKGSARVLRGGSFYNYRRNSRCANRSRDIPNGSSRFGGFRVVVSPVFVKSEL